MLMEKKVCCVTGHRTKDFLWNYKRTFCSKHQEYLESMSCFIDLYIRKFGYNYFICGGAIGVDTDFAEIVIGLRDRVYDHIKLEIAAPCRDQDKKWSKKDKAVYKNILEKADKVTYISERYSPDCMFKRNKYMVDSSDIVFAFWNKNIKKGGTFNTILYARRQNKPLELFLLNDY